MMTDEYYDALRDQMREDLGVEGDAEWLEELITQLIEAGWTHPQINEMLGNNLND